MFRVESGVVVVSPVFLLLADDDVGDGGNAKRVEEGVDEEIDDAHELIEGYLYKI